MCKVNVSTAHNVPKLQVAQVPSMVEQVHELCSIHTRGLYAAGNVDDVLQIHLNHSA